MNLFYMAHNRIIREYFKIRQGEGVIINGKILVKGNKNCIEIGRKCILNSDTYSVPLGYQKRVNFWCFENGGITIGEECGISNATFCSASHITLGDHVLIGGGVKIFDTDFHSLNYNERIDLEHDSNRKSAPIIIKDGAFIGAGSIILKGVTIGEKCIVAAGSVVTKNVPDGEIWGGNPAKKIRKLE